MAVTNTVVKTSPSPRRLPFNKVWIVTATLDYGSIASNSSGFETISVPGLDPELDFVISFNRIEAVSAHGHNEGAHVHTDAIHVWMHNTSGGAYNPVSADYVFLVGRMM